VLVNDSIRSWPDARDTLTRMVTLGSLPPLRPLWPLWSVGAPEGRTRGWGMADTHSAALKGDEEESPPSVSESLSARSNASAPASRYAAAGYIARPWITWSHNSGPANYCSPRHWQSDKISHIDMGDDHIDTVISHIISPISHIDIPDDHIDMVDNHINIPHPISMTHIPSISISLSISH
jgi:hypothetical protein